MMSSPHPRSVMPERPWLSAPPLPREHGAYGQLLMPLVTAFVLGGVARSSVALTLAVLSVFVAHESVLILLGHRGRRALGAEATRARVWFGVLTVVALGAFIVAVPGLHDAARIALLVLGGLGVTLFGLIWTKREKSLFGEIVAAVALTGVSFPVAVAGGAAPNAALIASAVWALGFSMAVLAVRGVIAATSTKAGGGPTAARISCGFALLIVGGAFALAHRSIAPVVLPVALTPFGAASVALFAAPPHARHLKQVGWALVVASTLAAVILALRLR